MSQTFVPPAPVETPRRLWRRVWDDPDSRSVTVGVLGMLLVHVLLLLFAPHMLRTERMPNVLRPHSSAREFNIEIAPDTFVQAPPKPPPPPFKFVETNPNAPENIPDKTQNFGAHNQQAAQEKPSPDQHNDRPAIEGQKEIHSTQIVTGQLQKLTEQAQMTPEPPAPKDTAQSAPRQEQNPLSGFEKSLNPNEDGVGTSIAKPMESAQAVPEHVEGVKNAPLIQGATATAPEIDPKRPRPRPQVVKTQQVRPAIFEENKFGTSNVGAAAYDAKWSNYGQYLQKMIETVQIQWERILIESRVYPVNGTHVEVKFRIDKEGKIAEIINVEGTAGNQAERACTSAITSRSPYGPWTDDMIAVLGESQEMTFSFYYQ